MTRSLEDLKHCAKRCTTHHEACDCKQLQHLLELEALHAKLVRCREDSAYAMWAKDEEIGKYREYIKTLESQIKKEHNG